MSLHTGASAPLPSSFLSVSPSVPFHSILPRSRHCSVFPFIQNKVSSGWAQCTPVFLDSLYLFLSSSPAAHVSFAKSLQLIVATFRIDVKSSLCVANRFGSIKRRQIENVIPINSTWATNTRSSPNRTKFVRNFSIIFSSM